MPSPFAGGSDAAEPEQPAMFKLPSNAIIGLAAVALFLAPAHAALAQSASLQQCANGSLSAPRACTGSAWTTSNISRKSGHYFEGDSVPFRLVFGRLDVGEAYQVTIQWDTTDGGRHAYDYITSFNRTESIGNDPCSGIDGCNGTTQFPIPADPNVADRGVVQVPGLWTLFGGTIVGESAYSVDGSYDGRSSASITVTFIAHSSSPVLAWGGHLASQSDWGPDAASASIPGAPFHVRIYEFDGKNIGSQDRSISSVGIR